MRKHDVRKWLHAILDLLPVILIPVFMVYSHRHDVTENVQVNYKYQSNEVNTFDDLVEGNIYEVYAENLYIEDIIGTNGSLTFIVISDINFSQFQDINDYTQYQTISSNLLVVFWNDGNDDFIDVYNTYEQWINNDYTYDTVAQGYFTGNFIIKYIYGNSILPYTYYHYTDYNVIESVNIENTNIMDSFMINFNNTIDKHFNMGNVFNLGDVYQWFNTNIFGGNAPVVIQSIYNIVIYELVMDLLFLLYGLFMWFIDMIQKLMEKPLNSIK